MCNFCLGNRMLFSVSFVIYFLTVTKLGTSV